MNNMKDLITETRWCKTHAPKLVGKFKKDDKWEWYGQCYTGYIRKEKCEVVIEKFNEAETQQMI